MTKEIFSTGWKALESKSYQEYLNSYLWQSKKEAFIIMHEGKLICEKCGSRNKIQVHHRTYHNVGDEHYKDLMALCDKCHGGYHGL